MQAQQADDQARHPIVEFIKKYQPLQNRYGEISGLRIASDRITLLDQTRDARAFRFWELMDIKALMATRYRSTCDQIPTVRSCSRAVLGIRARPFHTTGLLQSQDNPNWATT